MSAPANDRTEHSVKTSYAVSHLRAAARILADIGRQADADEASQLADRIETTRGGP